MKTEKEIREEIEEAKETINNIEEEIRALKWVLNESD